MRVTGGCNIRNGWTSFVAVGLNLLPTQSLCLLSSSPRCHVEALTCRASVHTMPPSRPLQHEATGSLPVFAQSLLRPGPARRRPAAATTIAAGIWALLASCTIVAQAASPSPSQSPFPQSGLLFPLADTWRVLDANTNLAAATATPRWVDLAYNDTAWTVGNGSLGFGFVGNGEKTTLKVRSRASHGLHRTQ